MLQAIRSRAGSIVVKILFLLLILSFGVWGIGDIFRSRSPETVIATVGDQKIRAQDLDAALRPALERLRAQFGAIDLQQAKQLGFVDTVLAQMIDRMLLAQAVAKLQLEVSDGVIKAAISQNPIFADPDGKFDRFRFNQLLARNRLSEDQYVASLRREIPGADLSHAMIAGMVAPPVVSDTLYRYRNEKRVAQIVTILPDAAGDVGRPDDAALNAFYDAHRELFRAPEYRNFMVARLSPDDLAAGIEIPDDKLKQEYSERQDEFAQPEQREVWQILAPSEDNAKEALKAVEGGMDWTEAAVKIAGQDAETVDLGLMKRQEIPSILADIAFELPLNTPSAPVKSPLGWHVLRVTRIEPPKTLSFDEAKPKLAADLARQEAADRLYKIANKVDDALAGGTPIAEAAQKFDLKTTTVTGVDVGGRGADGKPVALPGSAEEILKTAFATAENQTSRAIETNDGSFFILRVEKVDASHIKPLAEVTDLAVAAWQTEKRHETIIKMASELAGAATQDHSLATAAAAKKLAVATSPPLSRNPQQDAGVSAALVGKLFGAAQGGIVTADDAAGAYVAEVTSIEKPDPAKDTDKTADSVSGELLTAMQSDVSAEFTRALRRDFPVEIRRSELDHLF
jgi:peptidyl-prolyl cis-trans isomerase D